MTKYVLPILVTVCLLQTKAWADTVVFFDNFTSGASPGWGNEVGNWTAVGGVYFAQAPSNSPLTYTSITTSIGATLTDFAIDVDINDVRDGGIWLRSVDNANGILLVTGGGGSGFTGLYWHIVTGGNTGAILGLVTNLFTPGVSDPHIRVTVSGNTYSAFVNGSAVAATTLTTSTFSSGRAGLYDFSNQTFDNVTVTVASVPEPTTMSFLTLGLIGVFAARSRLNRRKLGR